MIMKELSQLEAHIQILDKMSGVLFEAWDDKISHIFKDKCVNVIKREWKDYSQQMTQLSVHLKMQMQELENNERNIKRVQDGFA